MSRRRIELYASTRSPAVDFTHPGELIIINFSDQIPTTYSIPTHIKESDMAAEPGTSGAMDIMEDIAHWQQYQTPFLVKWPPPEKESSIKDVYAWLQDGWTAQKNVEEQARIKAEEEAKNPTAVKRIRAQLDKQTRTAKAFEMLLAKTMNICDGEWSHPVPDFLEEELEKIADILEGKTKL